MPAAITTTENPFVRYHHRIATTPPPKGQQEEGKENLIHFGAHNTISNNNFYVNFYANGKGERKDSSERENVDRKQSMKSETVPSKLQQKDEDDYRLGSGEIGK